MGKVPLSCTISLQEKLDGYLQFMKSELEKKARINPEKFDDNLSMLSP